MPQGTQPNQVETDRFAAPDAAGIVGTAPDDDFDFLARLAAYVCETEMAAITFVDAERQFYKAAFGFKAPDVARDQSFCQHTVAAGSPFVVADALADDRFRASPLVSGGPRVRFYAGAPLRSSDGASFGALCVMGTRPRQLTAAQLGQLEGLAKQVTTLVESRRD
jgi:GAF domain-containing protein